MQPIGRRSFQFAEPSKAFSLLCTNKGSGNTLQRSYSKSVYFYGTSLDKLLGDYAAEAGFVKFAISHHMEGRHIVEEKILGQNQGVVMYPANHTNLHLSDVMVFNMVACDAFPRRMSGCTHPLGFILLIWRSEREGRLNQDLVDEEADRRAKLTSSSVTGEAQGNGR